MSSLDRDPPTTYWRSLEAFESELERDPELRNFVESEFPEQADDLSDPFSRRRFMQLMGASLALAGIAGNAGCQRWEREEIVPLSQRPENYVPGVPQQFATAIDMGGVAEGLVVTSYDGRPIKVEGNPEHPFSGGATTAFSQASVLNLYDPDRSYAPMRQDGAGAATWEDFESFLRETVIAGSGDGLRVLSAASSSPTLARLGRELVAKYPQAKWYEYEPISFDNERLGLRQAGIGGDSGGARAIAKLDQAARILTLDADIFVGHPARLRYARDYASRRRPDEIRRSAPDTVTNRLYAVESTFTSTGTIADHRLPLPSSHMSDFVDALETAFDWVKKLGRVGANASDRVLEQLVKAMPPQDGQLTERTLKFAAAVAADLLSRRGESVIIAGTGLPPEVHARVVNLNRQLEANNKTVEYVALPDAERMVHNEAIKALKAEIDTGAVKSLVILGGNPAYDAPGDLSFADAIGKVASSVHLSTHRNETSAQTTWHVPQSHYLESWGDARAYDGTVSVVQPLIEPLWGSKTAVELVAMMLDRGDASGLTLVRETFDGEYGQGQGDNGWRKVLHDGFVADSRYETINPGATRTIERQLPKVQLGGGSLEVVFLPSSHAYDGRYANNAWLQETPDFVTKLTWDNAALINPNTADDLEIKTGDVITLQRDGRSVDVAVYTLPGQARNSIALSLGHGRQMAGRVGGQGDEVTPSGFDVYPLRSSDSATIAIGVVVQKTGRTYQLVTTQDHWDYADATGRDGVNTRVDSLVREVTTDEMRGDVYKAVAKKEHDVAMPTFVPVENGKSLWQEHNYDGPREGDTGDAPRYKWGMAIDLDKCTGCNSCMLACQAENNVPVVGKEQVARSREMHWIRIDRYFAGDDLRDNPRIAHQPVACQQCENAPCEQVCPVGATIHSAEGLNDMIYNRCVGTRYCLNNCPYKVRRFNFLDYMNRPQAPGGSLSSARNRVRQLLFNPEVTVRSRGVMEKCTFCVQRIQNTKIKAKNERRRLRDGEVLAACQQACPTSAIAFGDLNDQDSMVSKAHAQPRKYALLGLLNVKPRNLFLARVRNPNPELG